MKRILLVILVLFFISSGVFAQDFSLTPRVVNAQGPNNRNQIAGNIVFTNNTTDAKDTNFSYSLLLANVSSGWDFTFCDPGNCRGSGDVKANGPFTFSIAKGGTGTFIADFSPANSAGSGVIKIYIKSLLNSANADTATFLGTAWNTAVKESYQVSRDLSVFPNPAKDKITIRYASRDNIYMELYNILGTRVKVINHQGPETEVNINDLQNGIYFVRFKDGGQTISKSFSKTE